MALFSDPSVGIADPMLRRAYVLAERGRGSTSPNPLVGCVVVADGTVIGEGYHAAAGEAHAEVRALDAAGQRARGADVYVTLEPCTHFGRTPPCVDRLLAEGVASVTIGMHDPDTSVSGGGASALRAAGVDVRFAEDPAPFEQQNEGWLTRLATGLPFVRVKVALTLDGRPALAARRRSRITGAGGREITMLLRSRATAVAVGAATVSVDDPALTLRTTDDSVADRGPQRFVLCRTSAPPTGATVLTDGRGCTLVTSDAAPPARRLQDSCEGVRVLTYPYRRGLRAALEAISGAGVDDVLIEAGPTLFTALWQDRLIDELVVISAGGMSGTAAPPLFLGSADACGDDLAAVFRPVECGIVEEDAVTVWRPRTRAGVTGREGEC